MSEFKHTPGPWTINEHAEIEDRHHILGRVYCGDVFPCEDEALNANAILIAAAPDLLEACKKSLIHLEHLDIERGLREDLRLVIEKATSVKG